VLAGGSRFAPNFIQNLYTVLKKDCGNLAVRLL
jgi:hypothetical protein